MKHPQPLDEKTLAQCEQQLEIRINVHQALAILGCLQLALRHPGVAQSENAGKFADSFARDLQSQITAAVPSLGFLCEAGWNKRFDARN